MRDGGVDRRRWPTLVVVGALVAAAIVLALAHVPRTLVAADGPAAWHVDVRPGLLEGAALVGDAQSTITEVPLGGDLDDTAVVEVDGRTTLVVGSLPTGTGSVRLHVAGGLREGRVHRVAWRSVHVAVLEGEVEVGQVVAIGPDGEVLQVADAPRVVTR